MNKKVEEKAVQSTYEKGIHLEDLFAEFMKSNLEWDSTKTRTQMRSSYTNRGSNVDVISERADDRRSRVAVAMVVISILGLFCFACMFMCPDSIQLFFAILIICAVGDVMFYLMLRYFKPEHGWVECKNRQGNVTFDEMQKTIHQLEAYKASGDKEYKFTAHYFVSANGYVDTALKLAKDKDVLCYLYKDNKFTHVS